MVKKASPKLVHIEHRRNADVIEAARHLLAEAEAGRLRGLAYVAEYTRGCVTGAAGQYRRRPSCAVGPAMDLVDALRALPEHR